LNIGVIACGAIATHISNIASREGLDITIYPLPPLLHNHPEKIAGEVESKYLEVKDKHQKFAVAYADCGSYGAIDKVIEKYGLPRLAGDHCYDVFATSIDEIEENKHYFLKLYDYWAFALTIIYLAEVNKTHYNKRIIHPILKKFFISMK